MFNRKLNKYKHPFHLVDPSPWPLAVSFMLTCVAFGFGAYLNRYMYGGWYVLISFIALLGYSSLWFRDIVREATFEGRHTTYVRKNIRLGFILFLISETMVFFALFWAYFHSMLNPSIWLGCTWPPVGINSMDPKTWPLSNTLLLLSSGFAITWSHYALICGNLTESKYGLIVTLVFSLIFISIQVFEYKNASFGINDSVYGSLFFMITGLHGLHVMGGTIFLYINGIRLTQYHFTNTRHNGYVFGAWYWHFVDVVWIFVYLVIYIGGS